uniref:Uncharacterized protein n=1 Tax=Myotis myotis TaxID=51298 RepID=A0A7J7UCT6_MYOMY|nr:hypothetical protein mMyoMyo1_008712 [Myotis myotis]
MPGPTGSTGTCVSCGFPCTRPLFRGKEAPRGFSVALDLPASLLRFGTMTKENTGYSQCPLPPRTWKRDAAKRLTGGRHTHRGSAGQGADSCSGQQNGTQQSGLLTEKSQKKTNTIWFRLYVES